MISISDSDAGLIAYWLEEFCRIQRAHLGKNMTLRQTNDVRRATLMTRKLKSKIDKTRKDKNQKRQ